MCVWRMLLSSSHPQREPNGLGLFFIFDYKIILHILILYPVSSPSLNWIKRVVLSNNVFIHANWVNLYGGLTAIATQGPLPETIVDFWQMVWDNNAEFVVMLWLVDISLVFYRLKAIMVLLENEPIR